MLRSTPINRKQKKREPQGVPERAPEGEPDEAPPPARREESPYGKVVEKFEQVNDETKTVARSLQVECEELQEKVKIYHTHLTNLKMEYERIQAKQMSKWWWLTIVILFILKYHSYAHRNIFGLVLCELGFIYNFRLLYVAKSQYAGVFGWFSIFLTVFFV